MSAEPVHLFSPSRPPNDSFASNSEPTYAFLNRTTRPEFGSVRDRLEDWFTRFPDHSKGDLAARFKSDNTPHHAAHFELFLHELLLRLGCSVEVHPEVRGRPTRPDFLATAPGGDKFYVEAALVTGQSNRDERAQALMDQALDVFDRICSPSFTLEVCWDKNPSTPLPARVIAKAVEKWLLTLDPDRELEKLGRNGFGSLPNIKFPEHKIGLEFCALAKKPGKRSGGGRPISFWNPPGDFSGTHLDVRKRIETKGSRYGELDAPFILALQLMEPGGDSEGIIQALFGDEVAVFSQDRSKPVQLRRKPNGAWTGGKKPAYAVLSGVLVLWNLRPWTKTEARATLYHNPWATRPYESVLNRLSHSRVAEKRLKHTDGESLQALLNL